VRVLVTGGTGYLGHAVAGALAAAGHAPVLFSRHASAAGGELPRVEGDVRSLEDVTRAAAGCDAICHLAGLVSIRRSPADFEAVNVGGLQNVLAAAGANGMRRLVYTSSFLALPPAGRSQPLAANDYQRTKEAALRVARAAARHGAPLVVVSPGVVYGPGPDSEGNLVGRLLRDHLRHRLPGLVGADRVWSFSFLADVAKGHVAALERGLPGAEYGLGGPNEPQVAPFEWLRARTGRRLPRRIPFAVAAALGVLEEARARLTGGLPRITPGAVEIFRHDWPVDSRAAVRDLDYVITPLDVGLEATLPDLRPPVRSEAGS
jgi:nucleoside-diphosphate-sugar epimerase